MISNSYSNGNCLCLSRLDWRKWAERPESDWLSWLSCSLWLSKSTASSSNKSTGRWMDRWNLCWPRLLQKLRRLNIWKGAVDFCSMEPVLRVWETSKVFSARRILTTDWRQHRDLNYIFKLLSGRQLLAELSLPKSCWSSANPGFITPSAPSCSNLLNTLINHLIEIV